MRAILAVTLALMAAPAPAQDAPFALEVVGEGFDAPIYALSPPGDPRLFVVEQSGAIRILVDGEVLPEPFLDVSDLISYGGEQGLLGLAFHPGFAENGRFFVNYTDRAWTTTVVEYTLSADPNVADAASANVRFTQRQPYPNHNGGWIDFGPEGVLYIGMGDGGLFDDPHRNGQNPDTALGKILTLDVDSDGPPKIFASGARNPWRSAFDGTDFYVADVGQGSWEEVNVVSVAGPPVNLGWRVMEGATCFKSSTCDTAGLTLPVHVYSHDVGCSITGGFVYRGSAIPALDGRYIFGDYCTGALFSFRYADGAAQEVTDYSATFGSIGNITSFGRDGAGELYVTLQDGRLMKIVPAS